MADDLRADPAIAAMIAHEKERALTRSHTKHRIHVDPVAHMVAHMLRRLTEVDASDRADAILDATAAVMGLIDPEES